MSVLDDQHQVDGQLKIKELLKPDVARWDDFVTDCKEATFFHRSGWKTVIEQAFGHKTYFLYAERNGDIEGVLPLGHVKSPLFGNNLISLPFCVYGGIAASTDEARQLLKTAACDLAEDLKVDSLEMRNLQSSQDDWHSKDLYVTFRKEIDPDPDANMHAIPRKQRAMVRKGIKAELIGVPDSGYERIYRIYSESVRNLGTPVFSKGFW